MDFHVILKDFQIILVGCQVIFDHQAVICCYRSYPPTDGWLVDLLGEAWVEFWGWMVGGNREQPLLGLPMLVPSG